MTAFGLYCCKTIFGAGTKNSFLAPRFESGILIHRTSHSDSIIAEFPWPGPSSGTFATTSAQGCPDPAAPNESACWGASAAHKRAGAVVGEAESDPQRKSLLHSPLM